MMYQDKLAVAIKNSGKVLREFKDTVYVPFGTEYSIFLKNLNSVRVRVNVEIDGKDIADGDSFIIGPGATMDLERFLKNGNMNAGNRFKFIERTSKVEAHRGGAQVEDGLVRISYEFDREPAPIKNVNWGSTPYSTPYGPVWASGLSGSLGAIGGSIASNAMINSVGSGNTLRSRSKGAAASATSYDPSSIQEDFYFAVTAEGRGSKAEALPKNEAGITAAGSISEQKFKEVSDIVGDGVTHVMVLRLLGEVGQQKVEQPVTVKHRPVCDSCGKVNKATAKFCSECGTSLDIV